MNHKHRKILHTLFAHPEPANLAAADLEGLLSDLGAEIHERNGAKFSVTLNGHTASFHHAHHSLPKDEVRAVRKFMETAGIDPERDFPL
jgi:hypothetical protein